MVLAQEHPPALRSRSPVRQYRGDRAVYQIAQGRVATASDHPTSCRGDAEGAIRVHLLVQRTSSASSARWLYPERDLRGSLAPRLVSIHWLATGTFNDSQRRETSPSVHTGCDVSRRSTTATDHRAQAGGLRRVPSADTSTGIPRILRAYAATATSCPLR